jgi:hypothetical protein
MALSRPRKRRFGRLDKEGSMSFVRQTVFAASAALLGAGLVSGLDSHRVAAAAPPFTSVQISGPLPMPVNAAQDGTWNVGLLGTPTVALQNSATMPLFFRNVDEPGRIPYQSINEVPGGCTGGECSLSTQPVPAGHRLVVTHVSGDVQINPLPQVITFSVGRQDGALITGFTLPQPYVLYANSFDRDVLFFVDGGQFYTFTALLDPSSQFLAGAVQTFTATGYLLDCTAAPCAPIAQ